MWRGVKLWGSLEAPGGAQSSSISGLRPLQPVEELCAAFLRAEFPAYAPADDEEPAHPSLQQQQMSPSAPPAAAAVQAKTPTPK